MKELYAAEQRYVQVFQRYPNDEELVAFLRQKSIDPRHEGEIFDETHDGGTKFHSHWNALSLERYKCLCRASHSLDQDLDRGDDSIVHDDHIAADIDRRCMQENISASLSCLARNEQEVMKRYYGLQGFEPMTHKEIGQLLGFSKQRAFQIRLEALQKMQVMLADARKSSSNGVSTPKYA